MKKYPEQDEKGWYWVCAYSDANDRPSMLYEPVWDLLERYNRNFCNECGHYPNPKTSMKKYYNTEQDARWALTKVLDDMKRMWELTYVWPELRRLTHLKFDGGTTTASRKKLEDIKKIADEQGLPYTNIQYYNDNNEKVNYTLSDSDRVVSAIKEIQFIMDKWGVEVVFYPDGGYYALRVDDKEYCRKDFGLKRDSLRKG